MPVVIKTHQAKVDLIEIADFLFLEDPNVSFRFLSFAEDSFDFFLKNPEIGRYYEFTQSDSEEIRSWLIKGFEKYLIFYRSISHGIEIVRVLHGARDIQSVC